MSPHLFIFPTLHVNRARSTFILTVDNLSDTSNLEKYCLFVIHALSLPIFFPLCIFLFICSSIFLGKAKISSLRNPAFFLILVHGVLCV